MSVVVAQFFVTLALSSLFWIVQGPHEALAGLGGGACAAIPAAVYRLRIVLSGGSNAKEALKGAYRAEALKFAATALMFALIFREFPRVAALPLFAVFIAALLVYPAALLFDRRY